jgi:alpha-glucosidase
MADPGWWRRAVLYQIYPRSFQDSDGDGVGDLAGVHRRLGYLVELGIDAIWLSPFFPSPMADFGYDIADYCNVDPLFGSLADFDYLLCDAHSRGLKVIVDLVPNHTSAQHPWFRESRSSRSSARRDWYIWRDPAPGGGPPNNWLSEFGGVAWEYDPGTGQYYYHAFLADQPDLNWRNPEVRCAMHDVMRFWLKRGVDGFRVDVIWHLIKDAEFRDNPPNPEYRPGQPPHQALVPLQTTDCPEMHDVIAELRGVADEFADRVLIGEIYLPVERLVSYYGRDLRGLHLPFNFALLNAPWNARQLATLIDTYEAHLPPEGWPNWVLGNHDRPRIASRVGPQQAAVAAMLLLTLRGTPTLYYGDEIGLPQVAIPPHQVRDPFELNVPGLGLGRDGCRTPMPWDASDKAAFTTGEPWLPLAPTHRRLNVENQQADGTSLLALHRRLLELRRRHPALAVGAFRPMAAKGDLLLYQRVLGNECFVVALNLGRAPLEADFAENELVGEIVLSTRGDRVGEPTRDAIALRDNEGIVIAVSRGG